MKKTLFAISAIAVLLGFTACTSENETLEPQASKTITIKAYTEETTRTELSGNDTEGYKVVWSTGDEIKIGGNTFTLNDGEGTTSGTFTGSTLTAGNYTAYYPTTYDGTNWPTAQTYTEGNITGSPMKATFTYTTGEEPSLAFKNEGGILRLNLKLEAESADARNISKIVVSSGQLADDIVLNCETAVALTGEGVPFHIAVPAKEYSNLTFIIYDNKGNKCTKSLSSGKTLTVERSQITPVNLTAKTWEYLGLCFTAEEAGATIKMQKDGTLAPDIQYSTDLSTWTDFEIGTTIVTLAGVGDKVYFRGNNPTRFSTSFNDCVYFDINKGKVAASGNVMSLVDPTCQTTTIPCEGCFYYLFYNCTGLTTAPELPATTLKANCYAGMFCNDEFSSGSSSLTVAPALPAETLADECYYYMFYGCTQLTTAPALPAETLADYCYAYMFNGCTQLTTAPALPAETLAEACYTYMFYGCTQLTTAPALPAETLVDYCYFYMFDSCSALETAPELPATALADYCYQGMFYNCTKLNSVTCVATDITASDCVANWLDGVAATGTFTKAESMTWPQGDSGIPEGWTVKTTTGEAEITGGTKVKWVQLWKDGPKWAVYNVGAASVTDFGGHYFWGKSVDQDASAIYNTGSVTLTGEDDTATKLWGSNWRMPTKEDFDKLCANCTTEWVVNYQNTGVNGRLLKGKGAYASNSIFFPATAVFVNGKVLTDTFYGNYWSSTPENSSRAWYFHARHTYLAVSPLARTNGQSVRAVLNE